LQLICTKVFNNYTLAGILHACSHIHLHQIIDAGQDDAKYVINVRQIAKFVVGLGEKVSPTDVEEGMRVGVDRTKYSIQIPLPPKIDPTVSLMTVEDKPDVTYEDVGGAGILYYIISSLR
jgi:ATP-dependent 26S proteasome regulatory subunit